VVTVSIPGTPVLVMRFFVGLCHIILGLGLGLGLLCYQNIWLMQVYEYRLRMYLVVNNFWYVYLEMHAVKQNKATDKDVKSPTCNLPNAHSHIINIYNVF